MRAIEKVYIDTNIFILAFENTGDISDLLGRLLTSHIDVPRFATSELTLSELMVKPLRQADARMLDTYEAIIVSSSWLDVLPVGRPVLQQAARLRADHSGLKLPDAIHVSTAFASECTHMLTADGGLKNSYEIVGYRAASPQASLQILRPDEPALTSLLKSIAE